MFCQISHLGGKSLNILFLLNYIQKVFKEQKNLKILMCFYS